MLQQSANYFSSYGDRIITEPNSGCWLWIGTINQRGYGRVRHTDGTSDVAHRLVYEELVGPIPEGLKLDHLCRLTCCVNPAHLEPVTQKENARRFWKDKTGSRGFADAGKCLRGHALTSDNRYAHPSGSIHCKRCNQINRLHYRLRRGEELSPHHKAVLASFGEAAILSNSGAK